MTKLEKLQLWCQIEGYHTKLRQHDQGAVLFISDVGNNPDARLVDMINGEGLAAMPKNYKQSLRVTEPRVDQSKGD
jgi:hypothetical protein